MLTPCFVGHENTFDFIGLTRPSCKNLAFALFLCKGDEREIERERVEQLEGKEVIIMNISRKRFGEDEEGGNPAVGSRSINRRLFDDNDGGDSSKGFKYTIEPLRNQLLRIGMVLFAAIICLYVFVTHGGFSALEDIESMVISKYSASTTHITSATPVRIPARASLTPPLDSHELIAHGERNGETGKLAESAKVKALDLPIVSTGNAKDSAPDLGLKGRVGSGMPIIPLHSTPTSSEAELRAHEDSLAAQDLVQYESRTIAAIEAIRDMKFNRHIVIENNAEAQRKVSVAQRMIRALLKRKYGNGPYRLEMVLEFPDIMVDDGTHPQEYNKDGTRKGGLGARQESLLVTMGDIEYIPYSVYFWLENILKPFHKGKTPFCVLRHS